MRNCFQCYFKDGNKLKTSLIQGFCPLKTELVRFLVRLVLKQRHLSSPSLRSLPTLLRLFLTFYFWSQIRELEVDLDNETRRGAEQQKICKKQERRIKDVLQQHEEDEKNVIHYKDQCDRLNKKVKTTKVNQEEAVCALSSPLSFPSSTLLPSWRLMFVLYPSSLLISTVNRSLSLLVTLAVIFHLTRSFLPKKNIFF